MTRYLQRCHPERVQRAESLPAAAGTCSCSSMSLLGAPGPYFGTWETKQLSKNFTALPLQPARALRPSAATYAPTSRGPD